MTDNQLLTDGVVPTAGLVDFKDTKETADTILTYAYHCVALTKGEDIPTEFFYFTREKIEPDKEKERCKDFVFCNYAFLGELQMLSKSPIIQIVNDRDGFLDFLASIKQDLDLAADEKE